MCHFLCSMPRHLADDSCGYASAQENRYKRVPRCVINPVPLGFIFRFKTRSRWSPALRSPGSLRISLPTVAKDPGCRRELHVTGVAGATSRWLLTLYPAQMQMGI